MSIWEKIKAEPGHTPAEILANFTKWERGDIYPPLGPVNIGLLIAELEGAGYIELRDGRAYPK
jgi:hypothetical protein